MLAARAVNYHGIFMGNSSHQPPLRFSCAAVLFDMDGTLVDSTAVVERVWRQWAARHGLDAERILPLAHGRRTIETIREAAPHLNFSEEEAARFDAEEARDSRGVLPVAGAVRVLSSLPLDRWAVVTSATLELASARLRFAGIPIPSVLVSADDVREGKPSPEGYLLAAARLGVPAAECLVIEDAPAGIEAGVAAGMRVIGIGATAPSEFAGAISWIPDLTRLRISHSPAGGLEIEISEYKI
jgi:sugar-phosphatase